MFRASLMDGKRILVTGGGTGLGRAMSEAFLSLGAWGDAEWQAAREAIKGQNARDKAARG